MHTLPHEMHVTIHSFGFDAQRGGGDAVKDGFVFDCRCVENAAALRPFAALGADDPRVRQCIEERTAMGRFLHAVWELLTVAIVEARENGRCTADAESLGIAFGCTSAQQQLSVYAADETAKWLAVFGGGALHVTRGGLP